MHVYPHLRKKGREVRIVEKVGSIKEEVKEKNRSEGGECEK